MTLSTDTEKDAVIAVLRLLNGPLCGCEYEIRSYSTLIVTSALDDVFENFEKCAPHTKEIAEIPENTIVVPVEATGNFEIVLNENDDEEFRVRPLLHGESDIVCSFQKVCGIGLLEFAVKLQGEEWSDGLLNSPKVLKRNSVFSVSDNAKKILALIGVVFAVILLSVSLLYMWSDIKEKRRVSSIAEIISGSTKEYKIIKD